MTSANERMKFDDFIGMILIENVMESPTHGTVSWWIRCGRPSGGPRSPEWSLSVFVPSRDEDPAASAGILDVSSRHGAAAFRASATNFGAARHLRVVHGIACIGALAADLRAGTAHHVVNACASQHCIGTGCTDIGARRQ